MQLVWLVGELVGRGAFPAGLGGTSDKSRGNQGGLVIPKDVKAALEILGFTIYLSTGLCPAPGTLHLLYKYLINEGMNPKR